MQDEEGISAFSDGGGGGPSVTAVRCVRDPETNIGKGFGYVQFSDANGASMALAKDGILLRKRPLRVTPVVRVKARHLKPSKPSAVRSNGAEGAALSSLSP